MRRIFWGFCRLSLSLSSRSYFGFKFAEILVIEKRLPAITDTGSRRLRVSVIQGVANSPQYWYAETPTPHITDTRSRQLPASPIWRVSYFQRKLSVSMIRRVVDSPHQWYGELPTPRIVESESRRLRVSPIWRVDDSAYHWVGESIGDTGSRYSKKKLIWCRFSELLTVNHAFKGPIWQKISQGCNLVSQLNCLKVLKKLILHAILLTPRLTDAGSRFSNPSISEF
jgi:hypothetical protein